MKKEEKTAMLRRPWPTVLVSELFATAACLLQPASTKMTFADATSPFEYDAPTTEIPAALAPRKNVTTTASTDGQAKSLYESCRFHQECSHRDANMRCVDFLCYCPAPFVLRGNGKCLEPLPSSGKVIASAAPAAVLLVVTLVIALAFLSRRLFSSGKDNEEERYVERPWDRNRPKTATMSRSRPPSAARGRQTVSRSVERNRRVTPPLPRIIRIPPDRWKENYASPSKADSPIPSSSANASATAQASGSDKPPAMTSFRKSPLVQSSTPQDPPPLSAAWLAQKLLASNQKNATDDYEDDDGIIIRVQREYRNVSPMATTQSKPPQVRPDRWLFQPQGAVAKSCGTRREREGRDNGNGGDRSLSLPIERRATSDTRRGSFLGGNLPVVLSAAQATKDADETGDEVSLGIIPSSLPVGSSGDVEKASSLLLPSCDAQDSLLPTESVVAPEETGDDSPLSKRGCVRLGSLKEETRWLSQSVEPAFPRVRLVSTERPQRQKSPPPIGSMNAPPVAMANSDSSGQKRYAERQSPPTADVDNLLGLGCPFVAVDEDPLLDTGSIALPFLSPAPSTSSDATQPRPDINSAMLMAVDAVEEGAFTFKELAEDARLVEEFVATALKDASLSDGAPSPLPLSGTERAADEEERVAMMVEERHERATSSGLGVSSPGWKVKPSSQTSPKSLSPTSAQRGRHGAAIPSADGRTMEGPEEESTSSSTGIENLAAKLSSLKVSRLDSSHRRAERTLKRQYSIGTFRRGPRTATSLRARGSSTSGMRSTRSSFGGPATKDMPVCLVDASSGQDTGSSAAMEATPVPTHSSVVEPATLAVVTPPELPWLTHSAEKPPGKAGSASSEQGQPVATPSLSHERRADAKSSSRTDSGQRRWSFLEELHRTRTANSRLVPPAAPTFHPAPQKVYPLSQDHLEPAAGCTASEERGLSNHVHSELPRPRSPFVVNKHMSQSRSEFLKAAVATSVDSSRASRSSRLNETPLPAASSTSPCRRTVEGETCNTKACLSSSTATATVDETTRWDEFPSFLQGMAPSRCWSRFWSGVAAYVPASSASGKCDAIVYPPKLCTFSSEAAADPPSATAGSQVSDLAAQKTFSEDEQVNVPDCRGASATTRSRLHQESHEGGGSENRAISVVPPPVLPRKRKKYELESSIYTKDTPTVLTMATTGGEPGYSTCAVEERTSKTSDAAALVFREDSAAVETKRTTLLMNFSSKDWSSLAIISESNKYELPKAHVAVGISPTTSSPVVSTASTLCTCEAQESGAELWRPPRLTLASLSQDTRKIGNKTGTSTSTTTSTDGSPGSIMVPSVTRTKSPDVPLPLEPERATEHVDFSSATIETSGAFISGLHLADLLPKLGIFPSSQLREQQPPCTATADSNNHGTDVPEESEAPPLALLPTGCLSAVVHCDRSKSSTCFSNVQPIGVDLPRENAPCTTDSQVVSESCTPESQPNPITEVTASCCTPKDTPLRGRPQAAASDLYSCSSRLSERRPHFFMSSDRKHKKSEL
ncbi:hypothetical protein HPB50_014818 [Hyalomma asiaticum]|uniref:Uncharacterized protein n=1 Tax=Hyalomma asiaticum TaxID=266040 RepID=A0ACB7SU48_HYAAI|nr:hypothetical protein HPB50_014818 [Hyalomma asiaticum]